MNHKTKSTRLGRLLLILAMVIALVAGTALVGAQHAKAEGETSSSSSSNNRTATSSDPVNKTVTSNSDGSYTLTLSAKGQSSISSESTKAEVVVVLDTSGSMKEGTGGSYTYQKFTGEPRYYGDYYGKVNGEYVKIYYGYYDSDWNYHNDWYYYDDSYNRVSYTDTDNIYTREYKNSSRLDIAKESTRSLVEQLLSNNTTENPDAVTVKLVTFNTDANNAIELKKNNYISTINGLEADGGTNWEAALTKANSAFSNNNSSKYVIFVSDGDPTFRDTGNGHRDYNNRYGKYGTGNSDPNGWNYGAAKTAAQSLPSGTNIYSIAAFGNVNKMQQFAKDLGQSGNYYSVSDSESLNNAFANIINKITNSFTLEKISFTDGITNLTSIQKVSADGDVQFTYKKNGTTENSGTTKGTIPAASYENGTITWNPTANGAISNGVTYSVSCRIWPSKTAYQQVANAKNDEKYTGLSGDISKDGNDYYLNSNTSSSKVSYDEVHTTTSSDATSISGVTADDSNYKYNNTLLTLNNNGKYQSSDGKIVLEKTSSGWKLTESKTLNLDSGKTKVEPAEINITKKWNNVEAKDQPKSIQVKAESTTTGDTSSYTATLSKPENGGDWTGTLYVAPGLNDGGTDLNSKTTYQITEENVDAGTYSVTYDPTNQTYTPVINKTTVPEPYNITITNTKIIKTGIRTENRAPFTAAVIGLGALAVVFVLRRRFVHR